MARGTCHPCCFTIVHEVEKWQGVLATRVVFSTVHEVGREQGVLTVSVVFSTVREIERARSTYYQCCFQYCT